MTWRLPEKLGRHWTCPLERDNPDPPPPCCEDDSCCGCDNDWTPTLRCGGRLAWRVVLDDGRWVDTCGQHELWHLAFRAAWTAAFFGPIWEPPFIRALKYRYPEEMIRELATRTNPFFDRFAKFGTGEVRYDLRIGAKNPVR